MGEGAPPAHGGGYGGNAPAVTLRCAVFQADALSIVVRGGNGGTGGDGGAGAKGGQGGDGGNQPKVCEKAFGSSLGGQGGLGGNGGEAGGGGKAGNGAVASVLYDDKLAGFGPHVKSTAGSPGNPGDPGAGGEPGSGGYGSDGKQATEGGKSSPGGIAQIGGSGASGSTTVTAVSSPKNQFVLTVVPVG